MEDQLPGYVTVAQSIPSREQCFCLTQEEQEAIVRSLDQAMLDGMAENDDDPIVTAYSKLKSEE